MLEWKDPLKELPKESGRYLALCVVNSNSFYEKWVGVIDVHFNPQKGWQRCESGNNRHFEVLKYFPMIELDKALIGDSIFKTIRW